MSDNDVGVVVISFVAQFDIIN